MSANTWQVWSSAAVILLSAAAALVVLPYAIREVYIDRRRLRGQFALGLGVLFVGISGRLTAALLFYFTAADHRAEVLHVLHPWILLTNGLIALGALQCIRLVTIRKNGEGMWLAVLAGSAILALVVAVGAQDLSGAHRHPPQDMSLHEKFYSTWNMPDNPTKSCCNKADCYPTEISYKAGVLFAKRREDGKWLRVPMVKIEQHRDNPDGRNHLCAPPPNASYPPDTIFCFALGAGG